MWFFVLAGLLTIAIGVYMVLHPEGSQRTVTGSGGSFSPRARRIGGYFIVAVGMVSVALGFVL